MLTHLLEDWCLGMEVDVRRALLVTGIPEDCGQAEIEETLHSVFAPLGPFAVRNRIFVRQQNAKAVLVEVGEGVSLHSVPREVPGRGGTWRMLCRDSARDAEGRLLQPHQSLPSQHQHPENWAEELGLLLGAMVQIIFYVDAEMRAREEERTQAAAEEVQARRKDKEEPAPVEEAAAAGAQGSPAVKLQPLDGTPEGREPPKAEGPKASTKTRSRKRRQKKTPKEKDTALPPSSEVEAARKGEPPEEISSKSSVKQEEVEKPRGKGEPPSQAPGSHCDTAHVAAGSPGLVSEFEQDGEQEGPPKKKAMGWAEAQSSMSTGKAGDVRAVSYSLADLGDSKKKLAMASPKMEPKPTREAAGQKDPRVYPPPTAQGSKAKPERTRACSASCKM